MLSSTSVTDPSLIVLSLRVTVFINDVAFCFQGRPGPKGDPGDSGLPGQKVSAAQFVFESRKLGIIHILTTGLARGHIGCTQMLFQLGFIQREKRPTVPPLQVSEYYF